MAARFTLGASERLKRQKDIEALFRQGKALSVFPLRLLWQLVPAANEPAAVRAGFSAPKKKFRRATERNRIKRLLREAWRLQRPALTGHVPPGLQLHVFILFTDHSLPEWEQLLPSVVKIMEHLRKTLPGDTSHA